MSGRLKAIAKDTMSILERGFYDGPEGRVEVPAVTGTTLIEPGDPLPAFPDSGLPRIEVTHESSLSAVYRLGPPIACLVFASARNPGGGFLNGAQAQEESLARASALYPSLSEQFEGFYVPHRNAPELTYTSRVIHSPDVAVFRDDKGALRPAVTPVSFLTVAAPNFAMIRRQQPQFADAVPDILHERAGRVLDVAAAYGHRRLVLGAWGCGVFGNFPVTVAGAFKAQLQRPRGFTHVTFAVLDKGMSEVFFDHFR